MLKKLVVLILFLFSVFGFSQTNRFVPKLWKLTALSGDVRVLGSYNLGTYDFENNSSSTANRVETSQASLGLSLNTKSFIYHPNLISLDISGSYDPNISKHQNLVQPDYSANNVSKFLRFRSEIMKKTKITVSPYYNYIENYVNKENFANVKSVFKNYGANLSYTNKYFPLLINFNNMTSNQLEINSNRRLVRDETKIKATSSRKYGENNNVNFELSRTLYTSYTDTQSKSESTTNNINLNNSIKFNTKRELNLRTNVNYYDFKIRNSANNRYVLNNSLLKELPNNLEFRLNQGFNLIKNRGQLQQTNNASTMLSHKWYQSLTSNISFEFKDEKHQLFNASNYNYGLLLNYSKNIPFNSKLNITYSNKITKRDRLGDSFILDVFNEAYVLLDTEIVLIDNSGVTISSVVVKDLSNTITYQENIDYLLVKNGNFIEIKRVPGGLIENNTSVLIDYNAIQPDSYNLTSNSSSFGINVSVSKNLFSFFYNWSKKDYTNAAVMDNLALDYFTRYKYGSKLNLSFLSAGIDYDNYKSIIVPYETVNYFVNIMGRYKDKLIYSGNWNTINYLSIGLEGRKQQFNFFSGNITYRFNYKTNLNLVLGYKKQKTEELELNWFSGRGEFLTRINSLEIGVNLNLNQKTYLNQNSDFLGGGIRLSRKF